MEKIITVTIILNLFLLDAYGEFNSGRQEISYRTYFGQCPTMAVGKLTLQLVKIFEQKKSLRAVKEKILMDNLKEKYYISSYNIHYDPLIKLLKFSFECPRPLVKVQIYKQSGLKSYNAILVDNGQLFDPNYEVLLRSENMLSGNLPFLALPIGKLDQEVQERVAFILKKMGPPLKENLSEVIINEENDLTVIFSFAGRPSSAFLGKGYWQEKSEKLEKIISYMTEKKQIPSIINLINMKKVVVKFSDKP